MPLRNAIVDEFLSAIEGLVARPTPTPRQPMRAPGSAGPQAGPDLEAARRAAGPARASAEGESAVRGALFGSPAAAPAAVVSQDFLDVVRGAQNNPEPRFRGELRPDVRAQPPAPPQPPTGLQNAPVSTQQLQGVMQRTGRQAQRTRSEALRADPAGRIQQAAGQSPFMAPSSTMTPAQRASLAETERARQAAVARLESQGVNRNRLPTPAQTTTRQALTPSQAGQPQTQRVAPPAAPPTWGTEATSWFNTHLRQQLGMTPDTFTQHYFAGFVPRPAVHAHYGTLDMRGSLQAPQDMVAPGRNGGPEVRIPRGTYLGTIERRIRPNDREAYNAFFSINDQYQGLGIARTIFRNQIDVYRRMGNIDRVTVSAGLDGGGHTWARFGFVPTRDGWTRLRREASARLRTVSNLSPAMRTIAETLLASSDPYAIRELAGLPLQPGSQNSALGRRLLAGTRWSGTLNLRNPRDMSYFDAYVTPRPRQ